MVVLPVLTPVAWAADPRFDSMSVEVKPEYDKYNVLAIFQGVLSPDTQLPSTGKFMIPKNTAGLQINMACEVGDQGGHNCKVYDTADGGDFNEVSYPVNLSKQLFLEYNWNPFTDVKDGNKSFTYEYKAPYDVKQLQLAIYEPKRAKDFKIEPASGQTGTNQEGLKTYTYAFDNVTKGQVIKFDVAYNKPDNQPSVESQLGAGPTTTSDQPQNRSFIVLMVTFILMVIAGIVGLAYWRTQTLATAGGPPVGVPARAVGSSKPKPKAKGGAQARAGKFCPGCGTELEPDDKFCSGCGAQARG